MRKLFAVTDDGKRYPVVHITDLGKAVILMDGSLVPEAMPRFPRGAKFVEEDEAFVSGTSPKPGTKEYFREVERMLEKKGKRR